MQWNTYGIEWMQRRSTSLSSKDRSNRKGSSSTKCTAVTSFLGLLSYYQKFLPNLATILHTLHDLLLKGKKWVWSIRCSQAVKTARQIFTTSTVLTHYEYTLLLGLAADTSSYRLRAVISHVLPNGTKQPIAFASRSVEERDYSYIDKDALGLIVGVYKFHTSLWEEVYFNYLIMDHKPFTTILGPKKGVPAVAAARMQQWAILLVAYNYTIKFVSTVEHGNADVLSCLPLPEEEDEQSSETRMCNIQHIEMLPVSSQEITQRDPIFNKVLLYCLRDSQCVFPKLLNLTAQKLLSSPWRRAVSCGEDVL